MSKQSKDDEFMQMVPAHVKNELVKLLEGSLSIREKWEIAKARAEAQGNARMVVADFLIEEGLMKRVFGKK